MKELFESIKIRNLVLVYVSVVIFFCIASEIPIIKSSKWMDENLFFLLCNLGILLWFIWKFRKSGSNVKKEISNLKSDLKGKDIVLSILINITLTVGMLIAIAYGLLYLWPSGMKVLLNELNTPDTSTLYTTIVSAVAATFIAPIVEEFMFRGVILNRLRIRMGVKKAIIVSSILFGMIHSEVGIISAVVFGVCMSLIYLKTNNIFTALFIHMINNSIVSLAQIILFFVSQGAPQQSITVNDFSLFWLIFGVLSLIISLLMSFHFIKVNWRKKTLSL